MTIESLLPSGSTAFEKALSCAFAEALAAIPNPFPVLKDPWQCPAALLPWLAWERSVDRWDTDWDEHSKRQAIANALTDQAKKGSVASIKNLLFGYDQYFELVEWFNQEPPGIPFTSQIKLRTGDGLPPAERAALINKVAAEIGFIKPLRNHYTMVEDYHLNFSLFVGAGARVATWSRLSAHVTHHFAQAQDGNFMVSQSGDFMDMML